MTQDIAVHLVMFSLGFIVGEIFGWFHEQKRRRDKEFWDKLKEIDERLKRINAENPSRE